MVRYIYIRSSDGAFFQTVMVDILTGQTGVNVQ